MDRQRYRHVKTAAAVLLLVLGSAGCREGAPPWAPPDPEPLTGDVRQLTHGYGRDTGPSWVPSGDSLYFSTSSFSYFPNRPHMLMAVSATGGTASLLEAAAHVAGTQGGAFALTTPVPSPDGTRLAYVHLSCANVQCSEVADARVRVRVAGSVGNAAQDPYVWLYEARDDPDLGPIYLPPHMVVNAVYRPAWSPDGARIAFAGLDGLQIWTLTQGSSELVPGTAGAQWAAWSPDGDRIAFTRMLGGDTSIVAIDVDGGNPLVLAAGREPAWSPDGQTVFHAAGGFIRRVARDGGPVQTVPGTVDGRMPAPSPDGRWLAFTRPKGTQPPLSIDLDVWVIDLSARILSAAMQTKPPPRARRGNPPGATG